MYEGTTLKNQHPTPRDERPHWQIHAEQHPCPICSIPTPIVNPQPTTQPEATP